VTPARPASAPTVTTSGPTRAEPPAPVPLGAPGPVLDWFARAGRDLPWRATRDPWAILVAETMLQQTQVARVAERWAAFVERYPTPAALAAHPVAVAIEEWQGLGYNRRALNLHRAAAAVTTTHDGQVPDTLEALLALPGVGPYTARAVLVFAFERDEAVLDTNVARIAARTAGRSLTRRQAQALLDAAVPAGGGWAWNQALIDVGARHCRSRRPDCTGCPLAAGCAWLGAGLPDPDPAAGTAAVSGGQGRFEGSDRQGRGRLVAALRAAPVPIGGLADAMGWPGQEPRAGRVAGGLVAEGLVEVRDGAYRLSGR
jgi:A/G-specific adenine glycosylase